MPFIRTCVLTFLLLAVAPLKAALETNEGFCANGAPANVARPKDVPPNVRLWGSACPGPMNTKTQARSSVFTAPAVIHIYISGFPAFPQINLWLENTSDGSRLAISPHKTPKGEWRLYEFSLPEAWRGKPVRLVAEDGRVFEGWWIGFSEPLNIPLTAGGRESLSLILRTLEHFLLLMLPSAAICAFAIRKDVRDPILVGAMALAATAIPGYFVFWVSLYSQRAGHRFAFLIALAALVFLVISLRKLDNSAWNILRQVAMPFALVGAQSLFVLLAGFAYGGLDAPSNTAANRFSHGLPPDNELPFMVAEGIRKNYVREPMVGDWKSSDRPPLQSGVFLAHHPFTAQPIEIGYTVVSVILQSLWIPGLWLLLAAFRLNAKAIGLALVFCAFSGFVLVNTIFVWPKLLAAAYLLGVFALLFSGRLGAGRQHGALVAAVAGLLLALSLLSHGGTVFALIGGGAAAALFRTPISLKHLILVGLTSFLIYLPWIGYQKFYDPPGDRLLKYHLAGVEPVDPRPFLPTLQDAYGKLTLPQIVEHKTANFKNYLQAGGTYWLAMAELLKDIFTGTPLRELGSQAEFLRSRIFFYLFPALGLSALGLLGLAAGINRRFRSAEWSAAFLCWLIAALSISFWCVLMFGPNTTANHTGAYAAVLLAMAGGVLSLWTITPNIAGGLVYLQIALNALIYGLLMKAPFAGAPLTEGYVRPVTVAAAFCALSLDVFLFWKLAEHRPDPELGREALREAVLAQNALP